MTRQKDGSAMDEAMELICENGFEGLDQAISILINQAMIIERARVLQAEPYERTDLRQGYANGFKPKTLKTRIGKLNLQVPQVRGDVSFYPSAIERGVRSERALKLPVPRSVGPPRDWMPNWYNGDADRWESLRLFSWMRPMKKSESMVRSGPVPYSSPVALPLMDIERFWASVSP